MTERYRLIRPGEGATGSHPGDQPVSVKVLVGEELTKNVRAKLNVTAPGRTGNGGHKHQRCEHVAYIVSGEAEVHLDDDPAFVIRQGDTLYVAPGVFHDVIPSGSEPLVTLMIDVPPED